MLIRAIIVRTIRNRGPQTIRARPRAHQQIRRRLRRTVRARRMIRGRLRELSRVIQCQVAVHLVRGDVMIPHTVLPGGFQETERALHIRPQERLRIRDRIIIMRLRRIMHNRIMTRYDPIQQIRIADVAMHELDTILRKPGDILDVARIRQRIQHRHMRLRMIVYHVMNEITADEAAATSYNNVLGEKRLYHSYILRHSMNISAHNHLFSSMMQIGRCFVSR